jgi:hypothetical protein
LSLHHPDRPKIANQEEAYDYSLIAGHTANNLLLTTLNPQASIRFSTSAIQGTPTAPQDLERMRITPVGHVGIGTTNPREMFQVGSRTAIHIGHEMDMLGYNFASIVAPGSPPVPKDVLMSGTAQNPGKAMKVGFSRHGYLELAAGSTQNGFNNEDVDWYEGGPIFGAFSGLTISNINGRGCASFGKYYPEPSTRLFVKAFGGQSVTDAFVAVSSTDGELFRVRNNNTVGVGQAQPRERLHIGELMTFHDGGSKFMGFNVYYDASAQQLRNIVADRPSVSVGINDGTAGFPVFSIGIDNAPVVGQVMAGPFKGLAMVPNGNTGIGTLTPSARLSVMGSGTTSATNAMTVANNANNTFAVFRDDGMVGIGTNNPSARLAVHGTGNTTATVALSVSNANGSVALRVRDDAKVLVGPTAIATGTHNDYRMSVDGKLVARSFVATETGWADDVFEPGYDLMPLDTLEAFIAENGHLPDVPTTAEVTARGVDVAETMVTLLRKVEELTLYVLELKRENNALRKELGE